MSEGHTALQNTISNCDIGLLAGIDNNTIEDNIILYCNLVVKVFGDNNTVKNNTIVNCDTELITGNGTTKNIIYHNNFIDNMRKPLMG